MSIFTLMFSSKFMIELLFYLLTVECLFACRGLTTSGYGIVLVSENTEGPHVSHCTEKSSMISTEQSQHSSEKSTSDDFTTTTVISPEDIGQQAAMTLIEEIIRVSLYHYRIYIRYYLFIYNVPNLFGFYVDLKLMSLSYSIKEKTISLCLLLSFLL